MIRSNTTLVTENRYLVSIKLVVMDSIKAAKYELIQEIMAITDNALISKLKDVLNEINQNDSWNELTEYQKDFLLKSIEDCDKGNVVPHEEVMAEVKSKYGI